MARIKDQSLELMKILSDARRIRILHAALNKPITVKQLAEELDEQPSRLYYHVKKLEDAELLQVVETKMLGNLVEKYYQAINFKDVLYRGNIQLQAEQLELSLSLMYQQIEPALKLFEKGLEIVREEKKKGNELTRHPFQITMNTSSDTMTAKEWRQSLKKIAKATIHDSEKFEWEDSILEQMSEEDQNKKGTYQYILLSYRIEDAEQNGIFTLSNEDAND